MKTSILNACRKCCIIGFWMFFENFIQNFVENFFCNFLLWFPMAISLKNPILLWEFFSHYSRNFSSNSTQSDSFGISFGNWFGKFPVNHTLESLLKIFVRTFGWICTAIPLEILTNFKFPTILMGLFQQQNGKFCCISSLFPSEFWSTRKLHRQLLWELP